MRKETYEQKGEKRRTLVRHFKPKLTPFPSLKKKKKNKSKNKSKKREKQEELVVTPNKYEDVFYHKPSSDVKAKTDFFGNNKIG